MICVGSDSTFVYLVVFQGVCGQPRKTAGPTLRGAARRRTQFFCCFLLPSRFVRASMPRGRWVFDEDLPRAMWQQILRGPRPPSVQWPRNQSNANIHQQQRSGGQPHSRNRRRWQSSGTRQRVPPTEARNVRESRTPDDDAVANQAHIEKLEKAIEILGEESPQAQGLIAALKQARERAVVPPIGVRLDSCQAFCRACQEAVAEEEVTKALRTKSTREFELEQGWQGWLN